MIEAKIIAITNEVGQQEKDTNLYVFGGKMAGICYMQENYFDSKIHDAEGALNRANLVNGSGHHSVFDHTNITFQLSGIPKILAMVLNSTEQYTTSEKSARYTQMKPETQLEVEIYNKWVKKFEDRITELYSDRIDDKTRHKLAMENARYLTSVFTPTHMAWTTSYRQVEYIIEWLERLADGCTGKQGDFNKKLAGGATELREALADCVQGLAVIKDNKDRDIEFMPFQVFDTYEDVQESILDVYQITYKVSFSSLAQLQRHRTIHCEMYFKGETAQEYGVFIPPIIRDTEMAEEWVADFNQVAYCFPQGTLVRVVEQGRAIKFFDKCKERLCGRAQLETSLNCKEQLQKFIDNRDKLSQRTRQQLDKIVKDQEILTKGKMEGMKCSEGCTWGCAEAFTRLV